MWYRRHENKHGQTEVLYLSRKLDQSWLLGVKQVEKFQYLGLHSQVTEAIRVWSDTRNGKANALFGSQETKISKLSILQRVLASLLAQNFFQNFGIMVIQNQVKLYFCQFSFGILDNHGQVFKFWRNISNRFKSVFCQFWKYWQG